MPATEKHKVIEELIGLAKQMREQSEKGEPLGLTEDEVGYYVAPQVKIEIDNPCLGVLTLLPTDQERSAVNTARSRRYTN